MIDINQNPASNNLISAQISNELTGDDYKELNPFINEKLKENNKINILFEFVNFDKINFGSVWQALKYNTDHRDKIERVAIIGNRSAGRGLQGIENDLTSAKTKFFAPNERDKAQQWISSGASIR